MKCKVLLNNEAVTVIDYDGAEVQIPPINCKKEFVNIIHDNGKFLVASDCLEDTADKKPKKKKKTTKKAEKSDGCIVFN